MVDEHVGQTTEHDDDYHQHHNQAQNREGNHLENSMVLGVAILGQNGDPASLVCNPVGDVSLYDETSSLHDPVQVLWVALLHTVHRRGTNQVVEAGHLEPGDVFLEDVQRHAAQVLGNYLLSDYSDAHLPANPRVELGILPLQLQRESLKLDKDIADRETPRETGETPESLEPELTGEEATSLEPGPDMLAAQTLGLSDNLLHRDRPPAERGGQLP